MANEIPRLLNKDDLPRLSWTGNEVHQEYVRDWFKRSEKGETELIGLDIGDEIIAFGFIDYTRIQDAGMLGALSVQEDKRSNGYGTSMVDFAIECILNRSLNKIVLHVETDNIRAIELYKRLGFSITKETAESWKVRGRFGRKKTYNAEVFLMEKELP